MGVSHKLHLRQPPMGSADHAGEKGCGCALCLAMAAEHNVSGEMRRPSVCDRGKSEADPSTVAKDRRAACDSHLDHHCEPLCKGDAPAHDARVPRVVVHEVARREAPPCVTQDPLPIL